MSVLDTPDTPSTSDAPTGAGRVREIRATCLGCVAGDLDRIEAAEAAGTLQAHGGWTAGQNLWHLARFFEFTLDGFPFRPPLPVRLAGRLMKGWALSDRPMPSGISLNRPGLDQLVPPDGVTFEDGLAKVRAVLARVDAGERFTHPSPLLGPLTHDEWVTLHVKHYVHHAGHLSLDAAG